MNCLRAIGSRSDQFPKGGRDLRRNDTFYYFREQVANGIEVPFAAHKRRNPLPERLRVLVDILDFAAKDFGKLVSDVVKNSVAPAR